MISGQNWTTLMSVDPKVNLICYIIEIDIRRSLTSLNCIVLYMYKFPPIVKLIVYTKLQYHQINFTTDINVRRICPFMVIHLIHI